MPGISGSAANCFVAAKFPADFVGQVHEMRFFMDVYASKSLYVGNLIFQGSNDDFSSDINDIVAADSTLHEGWNYFDLSGETYNSFRLFNAEAGGCDSIGELKLFGQRVINSSTSTLVCPVELVDTATDAVTAVT